MAKRIPPKNLHLTDIDQMRGESWRTFRIMSEFVDGFEKLAVIPPSVSIFGSARIKEDNPNYQLTYQIAKRLSDEGFSVVSGGGPGLMEAANKGAFEGKNGLSVGLNIQLPHEQGANEYQDISLEFRHFFSRKVMFVKYANAYVIMPGGFGTLDEMMEILVLIQTGKSRKIPVILVGRTFWTGLLQWFKDTLVPEKLIAEKDLQLIHLVDEVEEVLAVIHEFYQGRELQPNESEQQLLRGL